jgi:hypothetical protein
MNQKTAKKLRKITLTQWGGTKQYKEVYRSLKKNYIEIPKPQRGQFKKNLEIVSKNVSEIKKQSGSS